MSSQFRLAAGLSFISRLFTATAFAALAMFAIPAAPANASVAAHFSGVETKVAACSSECFGVAVDANGNVYIADTYNNRVLKETLSATGYTASVVGTGFNKPYGVAVDSSGNVYVADSFNKQIVKETLSDGTYTSSVIASGLPTTPSNVAVDSFGNVYFAGGNAGASEAPFVAKLTPSGSTYTQSLVADATSGMSIPSQVAVDSNGNVFVTDQGTKAVYEETPSGNSYVQSTVAAGLDLPSGMAVDSKGNVYIADAYQNQIITETPASGGGYTQSLYGTGTLSFPYELAADPQGNLYIANPQAFNVLKETPGAADFGSVNVGAQSNALRLIFAFDSAGAISTPSVVAQGASNLDFGDAGTGSCTSNGTSLTYSAGQTCAVDVVFKPTLSGLVPGAAVLQDHTGNQIAVGYVRGTGVSPQVSFLPGTQTSLPSTGLGDPVDIAVDASGNVFFFDGGQVLRKETYANGAYTLSTVFSNLGNVGSLAVDGAGNIYIGEGSGGCSCVKRESPYSGGYDETVIMSGIAGPGSLAVDSAGNVYIADNGAFKVYRVSPTATGFTITTIGTYPSSPSPIAVDGAGIVYAGNTLDGQLTLETPTATGYTQSTITLPDTVVTMMAVDMRGNLYTTDRAANKAFKWTYSSGKWVGLSLGANLSDPLGIAADHNGNVFIADTDNKQVVKIDFSDPPALSFASTAYHDTSADSPKTVTLENIGNAALSINAPTSGDNPSISSSFTLGDDASACPVVAAGSSNVSVSAGASCELSISFIPNGVGTISGSLDISDDALNGSSSKQTISLSGVATQATPVISWSTPAAITYGSALDATQLDATTSVAGTFAYSPAVGTVLMAGQQTLKVTFTPTDATDYTTATDSVTLAVNQATPTIALASSVNPAFVAQAITFTATVTSAAGTPTGSIAFFNGATQLGSTTLSAGSATYSTSALTIGSYSITAVYSGDANFVTVTSSALTQSVTAFAMASSSGGTTSATVSPGGTATYDLNVTPPAGNVVTFTVTGLPSGATSSFSPSTVAAGAAETAVKLSVTVPSQSAVALPDLPGRSSQMPIAFGLVLLSLPFLRRLRAGRRLLGILLLCFAGAASLAALSGCGGGSSGGGGGGQQPQTYNLTVTATAGPQSLNMKLTLTVQ